MLYLVCRIWGRESTWGHGEYITGAFGGEESLLPDSGSVLTLTDIQDVVELPSTLLLLELSILPCVIWKR